MTEDEALDYFRKSLTSGIQIATHAIGDRANRLLLDWIAKAMQSRAANGRGPIPAFATSMPRF